MVELCPAPFADLVARMHLEFERQEAIFDLPRRKWYVPPADGPDLSVRFHGHPAANPLGPASGPQTQMAQNIVLSWLGGGRIHELKTVQINDRLTIPRPCIDATNVGYNVEWSQELRIAESLSEYVAGAVLVHMLRHGDFLLPPLPRGGLGGSEEQSAPPLNQGKRGTEGQSIDRTSSEEGREGESSLPPDPPHPPLGKGGLFSGPLGDTIYDLSVGYDLKGIQSQPVVDFIRGMKDASRIVDSLRLQIPARWSHLRDLDYPNHLCTGITLSTFHGCPADEIERICVFLLTELDMDVVVKMNPPMLGKQHLEHLLHDVLGYTELTVNPTAYTSGLQFDESMDMCSRLTALAAKHGRHFGAKFSNTLEVLNHRDFFTKDNQVMYLSGAPLHVLTLTLADIFRQAVGPDLPITFSAGVDKHNFANMVACGFCPITTCTDLLRPGGYARLPAYLEDLTNKMKRVEARTVNDYILDARGQRAATQNSERSTPNAVNAAAAANLRIIAEETRNQERYRAAQNRAVPKRIGTHLVLFDCVSCDKCVPVCPNDANFIYELPIQKVEYRDWVLHPDGRVELGERGVISIERTHQIANFADFCNECGNCDTFCPEYGGPFIEKPNFFGTVDAWTRHAARDGFCVVASEGSLRILGRMKGREYRLDHNLRASVFSYSDGELCLTTPASAVERDDANTVPTVSVQASPCSEPRRIEMRPYHILRLLLEGICNPQHVNQINASLAQGADQSV